MVVAAAAFGPTVLQLAHLALWDQVVDRPVIIMRHHTHLLLDRDIPEGKVDTILPILSNIVEQVVVVVQANKVAPVYTMMQIERLKVLIVKAVIMNGTVPTLQIQDGLQVQQRGVMVAMV
jgi:hypothetical protein